MSAKYLSSTFFRSLGKSKLGKFTRDLGILNDHLNYLQKSKHSFPFKVSPPFAKYAFSFYLGFLKPEVESLPSPSIKKPKSVFWSQLLCQFINTPDDAKHFIFSQMRNRKISVDDTDPDFHVYKPHISLYWAPPPAGFVSIHMDSAQRQTDGHVSSYPYSLIFRNDKNVKFHHVIGRHLKAEIEKKVIGVVGEFVIHPKLDNLPSVPDDLGVDLVDLGDQELAGGIDYKQVYVHDMVYAELLIIWQGLTYYSRREYVDVLLYVERDDIFKALALNKGLLQDKYTIILRDVRESMAKFNNCVVLDINTAHNCSANFLAGETATILKGEEDYKDVLLELKEKYLIEEKSGRCRFIKFW